jgi:hypothetical protein
VEGENAKYIAVHSLPEERNAQEGLQLAVVHILLRDFLSTLLLYGKVSI